MLRIEQVHKWYPSASGRVHAVRDVSMTFDTPGLFGIMGTSGSGKSTLLHLIAGLDQPDAGRVLVDDVDLATLSERRLTIHRRRHMGMVFQQYNLIGTLNARQNVELPAILDGRSTRWARDRAETLLAQLTLTDRATHMPDALSGGEQQRVAIARALVFEPPLLLADEPTGALDSTTSRHLWTLLSDLAAQQSMTILMVTHEPAAAIHCDRVFVLADGTVRGTIDAKGLDASSLVHRYQQLAG